MARLALDKAHLTGSPLLIASSILKNDRHSSSAAGEAREEAVY
jgi:hypothetical protein